MEDKDARRKRKEEAKRLKRKRIEEAGGVRPRSQNPSIDKRQNATAASKSPEKMAKREKVGRKINAERPMSSFAVKGNHRFGRVMENVPCRNKARFSTLSIALPGSVVSNCQTRELRTQLVGQIARAAVIYHVDEVVVFDDKLAKEKPERGFYRGQNGRDRNRDDQTRNKHDENQEEDTGKESGEEKQISQRVRSDPHTFMARVLQYCECPQYLRRHFFPMHPDLQFAGLLCPIDAPHHVRAGEKSRYREGVVLEKKQKDQASGSFVNCGIRGRPVEIDRVLTPGIRCTVRLDENVYSSPGRIHGTVVAPSAPREDNGTYWGYTTRLASCISAIFDECPFEGGYDLKIGTSERGSVTVEDEGFSLPVYKHSLVVFGGVAGIEECVDADESVKLPGSQSSSLFDIWVNTCPFQGSRTIRTEEAVLISLARLNPCLSGTAEKVPVTETTALQQDHQTALSFTDDEPSEESSGDSDC